MLADRPCAEPGSPSAPAPQPSASSSSRCSSWAARSRPSSISTELLQKIPQLIARLTKFQAFAVYLLDPRRRRALDRLLGRLSRGVVADAAGQGRARARRRRRRRRASRSSSTTCAPIRATSRRCPARTPSSSCRCAARAASSARSTCSATRRGSSPRPTKRCCGSSARTSRSRSRTRGSSSTQREYTSTLETLAEIGREFGAILNLDELLTRIANLTRGVIDYRTFGILLVNEETSELEMKVAVRYGDSGTDAARASSATASSATRRCTRKRCCVPDVSTDPRYIKVVDDARSELVIPLMLQGSLHRRLRPREPRARRVHEEPRRDPDAARQPGGGRDRERAALRDDPRQRGAAREGDPLRAARPGGAAADRAAQADEERRRRGAVRAGARARRRPLRLPRARAEQPRRRRRRRVGQGRAGGALQRVCRRAGALAHVPPPLRAGALHARRACSRRPTRSCTSASSRSTTARSATRCSISSGATVTLANSGLPYPIRCSGEHAWRRSCCRACRSARLPDRPTTS